MAGRQPPESRIRHSFPTRTPSQRSTSRLSNPNVFSDDFALEPLDSPTSPSISPVESNDSIPESSSPQASATRLITSNHSIIDHAPSQPRNSTSKRTFSQRHGAVAVPDRTQSTVSRASMATSVTQRTASTASRFSMPRPPSPYTGATGPSHPYQMYPQATRTSSTSTIRPPEAAFVGSAGPEHPYALYPQNTVPEEDAAEIVPASMIPVGFPGMGQRYQRHVGPQGEDVADIIGPDGHAEQLPPYTRYADDMPRKYDAAAAEVPVTSSSSGLTQEAPLSDMTTLNEPVEMGDANRVSRTELGEPAGANSLRDIWRRNCKKRVCCGLPLWVLLGIICLILVAAAIGGVLGSIVGSENSNKHHHHHGSNGTSPLPDTDTGNSSAAASTTVVTATSWIDATPLPTNSVLAGVPVGGYSVPLYQVKATSATCVVDPALSSSWGCMPPMSLDINVTQPDPTSSMAQVSFEPYPLVPNFTYGAQAPDLGGSPFQLAAFLDKDDTDLGPALFFVTQYPKIVILPQNAIAAGTTSKRSIPESEILQSRGYGHNRNVGQPGDMPWFCFWNNTVLEFFIYVSQDVSNPGGSSSYASTPTTPAAAATASSSPTSTTTGSNSYRRDAAMYAQYPRYVKVQEKRKPYGNIAPYCQQMQILYDGTWNPAPNVPIVSIQEIEPSATAASSPMSTTAANARRVRDVSDVVPSDFEKRQNPLDSLCYCQWLAT